MDGEYHGCAQKFIGDLSGEFGIFVEVSGKEEDFTLFIEVEGPEA